MQVKDTVPSGSCPSNCTCSSQAGEDSTGSWPEQQEWVQRLCWLTSKASLFSIICSYAILSISGPVGGQGVVNSPPFMAARAGSYMGFYVALASAWLTLDVALALPNGWPGSICSSLVVCSVIAVIAFTHPH